MAACWRWTLGLALLGMIVGVPTVFFRATYAYEKRLREVDPGRFYRSGQMTVEGFTEAIRRLGLHTIINVQDDVPDPELPQSYFHRQTTRESELCRRLGVRYVMLAPDLVPRREAATVQPKTIRQFLALMDDPKTYPALIHCKAGLHRTGCLTAVYRMEYLGWTPYEAVRDLRANGFGCFVSTSANDYILDYILSYRPRNEKSKVQSKTSKIQNPRPLTLDFGPWTAQQGPREGTRP
jgi:tyrosine-protein phosphatase SIW14